MSVSSPGEKTETDARIERLESLRRVLIRSGIATAVLAVRRIPVPSRFSSCCSGSPMWNRWPYGLPDMFFSLLRLAFEIGLLGMRFWSP